MLKYLSICSLTLLLACNPSTKEANSQLQTPKDFEANITKNQRIQLVDVRTLAEYEAGQISNAKNIDFYADSFEIALKKLDREAPLYIYCAKGGRSAKACSKAKALGFKQVVDLEGGFEAWQIYQNK